MPKNVKKSISHAVRIAICLAAFAFVIRGVTWNDRVELLDGTFLVGTTESSGDTLRIATADGHLRTLTASEIATDPDGSPRVIHGVRSTWTRTSKPLLLAAFLVQLPVVLPLAARFRVLLAVQGIALRFGECLKLAFAGNFLNFATPLGSNAGDVFKAYFVSLHTPDRKTEAVATVILDRVIGLGTLLVIATLITCLSPSHSVIVALRPYFLTLLSIGVAIVIAYISPWGRRWIARTDRHSTHAVVQQLHRVDRAARILLKHKTALALAIALTILLQLQALSGYFLVSLALSFDAGLAQIAEFFAYFYTGSVVQSLPGPPQGLGTVELTYRYFFAAFASPSQIVCMALTIRLINLLCALPGLWVTMTGAYRPATLDEMTTDAPADALACEPA